MMWFRVGLLALLLSSCTSIKDSQSSQAVSHSILCIFAVCETADRTDRIGDPSNKNGTVNESVDEANSSEQDATTDLELEASR